MQATYSQAQVISIKRVAKIIGNANNLLILYELMNFGEKSFNELKRMTGINAVTLSKKLSALKAEGIVDCQACGTERRYSVTTAADELRPLIEDIQRVAFKN